MNYFLQEVSLTRSIFDLELLLQFQLEYDVQIIRGDDYMYNCYIEGQVYSSALTPLYSLIHGILIFKKNGHSN